MKKIQILTRAYTLIEVLIAAAILLLVVAAAASLSGGLTTQELLAQRTTIALNHQEQAARLWQLGLSPTAITNILPPSPSIQSVTFAVTEPVISGIGTMQRAECGISFQVDGVPDGRTNNLILLRPRP